MLRRLWNSIRTASRQVGTDLQGNRFYEHPSSTTDLRRTRRTVEYSNPDDMWRYVGGDKRLPVQWTAWLTHTRPDPPTLQELEADLTRQHRVSMNAALIAARDRDERIQSPPVAAPSDVQLRNGHDLQRGLSEPHSPASSHTERDSQIHALPELPRMASQPSYEPQSWTPRASVRGSSS